MTPTYDPLTKTWFLEDGREAETLADFHISLEGYYPGGVPLAVIKQKMDEAAAILGTHALRPKTAIPMIPSTNDAGSIVDDWRGANLPPKKINGDTPNRSGRKRIYDHEGILADRAAGLSYQAIVEKRNLPSRDVVGAVVSADNKRRHAS